MQSTLPTELAGTMIHWQQEPWTAPATEDATALLSTLTVLPYTMLPPVCQLGISGIPDPAFYFGWKYSLIDFVAKHSPSELENAYGDLWSTVVRTYNTCRIHPQWRDTCAKLWPTTCPGLAVLDSTSVVVYVTDNSTAANIGRLANDPGLMIWVMKAFSENRPPKWYRKQRQSK